MKKISILFCMIVLIVLALVPTASAAGTTATIGVTNPSAQRGDVITLTAVVTTPVTVTSGAINLEYDKTVFAFESGVCMVSDALLGDFNNNNQNGVFLMSEPKELTGELFSVTFRVLDDAPIGIHTINLLFQMKDSAKKDVTILINGGHVNVWCDHTFTATTVADQYLQAEATCTTAAVYYKSCVHCGEVGTTTFSAGVPLGHELSGGWITSDAVSHWKECGRCHTPVDKATHQFSTAASNGNGTHSARCACGKVSTTACAGGTATCTDKAVCTVCKTAYGTPDPDNHSYSATLTQGSTTHYYSCSRCAAKKGEAPHTYASYKANGNSTHTGTCACGKTHTASCAGGTATCTDKAVCTVCKTAYGTPDADNHSYSATLTQGSTTHYYSCSRCAAKKGEAAHAYTLYTSMGNGTHRSTCVCGKTHTASCAGGTATCTDKAVCTVCKTAYGAVDADNHSYGTTLTQGSTTHYYSCSRCAAKKSEVSHIYLSYTSNGNNTHTGACVCGKTHTLSCTGGTATCQVKATCTTCGSAYGSLAAHKYATGEWGYREPDGHAHVCTYAGCHAHTTVVSHTSSGAATETTEEVCTVCAYVIAPALGHITHTPVSDWSSNATHHWHACVGCSTQELNKAAHVFDNACDTTCNTCGYVRAITHNYTLQKHDNTHHWYVCVTCGEEKSGSRVSHSGGTATCTDKAVCSVCNIAYGTVADHSFTVLQKDADKHWYTCAACGEEKPGSRVSHSGGTATCTDKAVCSVCNTAYGTVADHSFTVLQKDEDGHWYLCSACEVADQKAEHTYGENGVCSVCAHEKPVETTAPVTEETTVEPGDETTSEPGEDTSTEPNEETTVTPDEETTAEPTTDKPSDGTDPDTTPSDEPSSDTDASSESPKKSFIFIIAGVVLLVLIGGALLAVVFKRQ